jgi:hypothetical protein
LNNPPELSTSVLRESLPDCVSQAGMAAWHRMNLREKKSALHEPHKTLLTVA